MKPIIALLITSALAASASARHVTYSDAQHTISAGCTWTEGQTVISNGSNSQSTTEVTDWMESADIGGGIQPRDIKGNYGSKIVSQISAKNLFGVEWDGSVIEARIPDGWTITGEARMSISFTFTASEAFNYEATLNLYSLQPAQGNTHSIHATSLDALTVYLNRFLSDAASFINAGSRWAESYHFEASSLIHGGIVGISADVFASPIPEPEAVSGVIALTLAGEWVMRRKGK